MKRSPDHPDWAITFVQTERGDYFWVRVPAYRATGEHYLQSATFSVKKHGGVRATRTIARERRDELKQTRDGARYSKAQGSNGRARTGRRDQEGMSVPYITGVHLLFAETRGRKAYVAVAGQIGTFGYLGYKKKTFSCRKYGVKGALERALEFRLQAIGENAWPSKKVIGQALVALEASILELDPKFYDDTT